jgi:ATP-dependent helicase Lhr and Lhr-like helicase
MLSRTLFHPSVTAWFEEHFKVSTPAQADAWPLIKAGRNVLIAAPTGSGKTLAAFMAAIDDLLRDRPVHFGGRRFRHALTRRKA